MRKALFALFMLAAVLATASTVVLKSQVTVGGKYVTLYDLAATFDGVATGTLKNFTVAFAPQPGTHYEIDANSVRIRAEQSIKWLDVKTVSDRITVYANAYLVDLTRIQRAISEKTATTVFIVDSRGIELPDRNYTVAVENVSRLGENDFALVGIRYGGTETYSNVTFETGLAGVATDVSSIGRIAEKALGTGITLSETARPDLPEFDAAEVGSPFKESQNAVGVPVNFVKDGKIVFTAVLKYTAHRFLRIVVSAKPINYGQKLTKDLLAVRTADVYATTTKYATSIEECVGKIAAWSFSAGQVLSRNGLRTPPDVVAGQILIAYINYPGLIVTAFVRAMQAGNSGQIISVRNVDNGYLLHGMIEKGPRILVYSGGE